MNSAFPTMIAGDPLRDGRVPTEPTTIADVGDIGPAPAGDCNGNAAPSDGTAGGDLPYGDGASGGPTIGAVDTGWVQAGTDDTGDALAAGARAHVEALLHAAPLAPAYRAAITAALAQPGNLLSAAPDLRWARTVGACCAAAGGDRAAAVPVAAAVELFMVALDVLDDVEDAEETPLRAALGTARALNAATGLLLLAQQALLATAGAAAAALLLDAGLRACSGQDADLAPLADGPPNLEAALGVTAGKAAPLVAVACRLGAACAGADAASQEQFARFGALAGMVSQLANDLAALAPRAEGKTDLALQRPTLPLVHARHYVTREAPDTGEMTPPDLLAAGSLQLTWTVAETYHRHALDLIPQLTGDPASRAELAALARLS